MARQCVDGEERNNVRVSQWLQRERDVLMI